MSESAEQHVSIPFPYFGLRVDKQARVLDPADDDLRRALLNRPAATTDLIVLCHGWNNDMAEAENLYARLLGQVAALLGEGLFPGLAVNTMAVLGVFWPSKKYARPALIPGNAAGNADGVDSAQLGDQLAALRDGFDAADANDTLAAMRELLPGLRDSDADCEAFLQLARRLVVPADGEADPERETFFTAKPLRVFQRLAHPVQWQELSSSADGSTAAAGFSGEGQALGVSLSGIGSAASNVLNLVTYYQMKERAGLIGSRALNPLLRRLTTDHPRLRLHLVGHSFGGRLLTATVAGEDSATLLRVHSLSLLQAAFSHYGFARNWDGQNRDGAFRRVLSEAAIKGPLLITHTSSDWAVGLAYPLASLLRGQNAAGLVDEHSDYGGIGRNGARKTPEAVDGRLLAVGEPYAFSPGRAHNLNALYHDRNLIKDHGDVSNREVAYAVLSAIASSSA